MSHGHGQITRIRIPSKLGFDMGSCGILIGERNGEDKPAVRKLRVNTEEAINLRQIWESRVEEALHTFHTHSPDPTPIDKWKAICRNICRDTAVSQLAHLSVSSLPVPAQGQKRADPPTGTPNKNGPRKDSRAER